MAPTRPIAKLPDGKAFRRRIANHLPSRKLAPVWLQAVADMAPAEVAGRAARDR